MVLFTGIFINLVLLNFSSASSNWSHELGECDYDRLAIAEFYYKFAKPKEMNKIVTDTVLYEATKGDEIVCYFASNSEKTGQIRVISGGLNEVSVQFEARSQLNRGFSFKLRIFEAVKTIIATITISDPITTSVPNFSTTATNTNISLLTNFTNTDDQITSTPTTLFSNTNTSLFTKTDAHPILSIPTTLVSKFSDTTANNTIANPIINLFPNVNTGTSLFTKVTTTTTAKSSSYKNFATTTVDLVTSISRTVFPNFNSSRTANTNISLFTNYPNTTTIDPITSIPTIVFQNVSITVNTSIIPTTLLNTNISLFTNFTKTTTDPFSILLTTLFSNFIAPTNISSITNISVDSIPSTPTILLSLLTNTTDDPVKIIPNVSVTTFNTNLSLVTKTNADPILSIPTTLVSKFSGTTANNTIANLITPITILFLNGSDPTVNTGTSLLTKVTATTTAKSSSYTNFSTTTSDSVTLISRTVFPNFNSSRTANTNISLFTNYPNTTTIDPITSTPTTLNPNVSTNISLFTNITADVLNVNTSTSMFTKFTVTTANPITTTLLPNFSANSANRNFTTTTADLITSSMPKTLFTNFSTTTANKNISSFTNTLANAITIILSTFFPNISATTTNTNTSSIPKTLSPKVSGSLANTNISLFTNFTKTTTDPIAVLPTTLFSYFYPPNNISSFTNISVAPFSSIRTTLFPNVSSRTDNKKASLYTTVIPTLTTLFLNTSEISSNNKNISLFTNLTNTTIEPLISNTNISLSLFTNFTPKAAYSVSSIPTFPNISNITSNYINTSLFTNITSTPTILFPNVSAVSANTSLPFSMNFTNTISDSITLFPNVSATKINPNFTNLTADSIISIIPIDMSPNFSAPTMNKSASLFTNLTSIIAKPNTLFSKSLFSKFSALSANTNISLFTNFTTTTANSITSIIPTTTLFPDDYNSTLKPASLLTNFTATPISLFLHNLRNLKISTNATAPKSDNSISTLATNNTVLPMEWADDVQDCDYDNIINGTEFKHIFYKAGKLNGFVSDSYGYKASEGNIISCYIVESLIRDGTNGKIKVISGGRNTEAVNFKAKSQLQNGYIFEITIFESPNIIKATTLITNSVTTQNFTTIHPSYNVTTNKLQHVCKNITYVPSKWTNEIIDCDFNRISEKAKPYNFSKRAEPNSYVSGGIGFDAYVGRVISCFIVKSNIHDGTNGKIRVASGGRELRNVHFEAESIWNYGYSFEIRVFEADDEGQFSDTDCST